MNKLTGYITVFALILVASCSFGQASEAKSETFRAAKLYVNSDFHGSNVLSPYSQKINLLNEFSPAFSWGKNYGNFQEVSVRDIGLMFAANSRRISSNIGYSYNFKIFKLKPESKFSFYLGAGASVGYEYLSESNSFPYEFNRTSEEVSMNLNVIPRITYKINDRTFVDLNIPYSVYSSSKRWSSVKRAVGNSGNSSSPVNNRTFPNQFTVSVGVAIKF